MKIIKIMRKPKKRKNIIMKMARGLGPDSGWLEDLDPTATGSRTWTPTPG